MGPCWTPDLLIMFICMLLTSFFHISVTNQATRSVFLLVFIHPFYFTALYFLNLQLPRPCMAAVSFQESTNAM